MRGNSLQKICTMKTSVAGQIVLAISMMVVASQAQVPGYNAGAATQQATPPPVQKPMPQPAAPIITQQEEKPLQLHDGEKLLVKEFVLDGIRTEDQEKLLTLLSPFKNQSLSMAEITEAANRVTLYYRNQGYLVAKAYVPVQDASNGQLLIRVVLGKYGKFILKNNSHVRNGLLQSTFDKTTRGQMAVTRDSLERAMLLVRDLPGSKMPRVAIEPGVAPQTSNFVVDVDADRRVSGYLMGDNQGSQYTGTKRLYGGVDVKSPFTLGDKFSLSAMTSEAEGLGNLRIAYSLPLRYNGLRLELAASKTKYSLSGTYRALDATGLVDDLDATLSYPITRSRSENFDVSLNFARKWMRDDLAAVDALNRRSATVATLTLQHQRFGHWLRRNTLTTIAGSADIGNINPNAGAEAGTPRSIYARFNVNLSENVAVSDKLTASAALKLQKAGTSMPLDSSEQMYLSGNTGVKAFSEGVSSDNGYLIDLDARYALPAVRGLKQVVGGFVDNGGAYAEQSWNSLNGKLMVSDVGVGYYANFKTLFATVQMAQAIGNMAYHKEPSRSRAFFQVGMTF